jgi:hypothetical protein
VKDSEMLRTIANDLRVQGSKLADIRKIKAASVLVAAAGFGVLRSKLGGSRG